MRYMWRFRRLGVQRWELVLVEDDFMEERVVRAPGYESTELGDILQACWYLNGSMKSGLPEHKLRLLDRIREECRMES